MSNMQLKQVSPSFYEVRIEKMKKRVILQPHEICIERARLITEFYKANRGEK